MVWYFILSKVLAGKAWLSEDNLHSSLSNIRLGKFWVLLTATVCHNKVEHLIDNLTIFMVFLEQGNKFVGGLFMILLCFTWAAFGWIFSIAVNSLKYGNSAEWITSFGASPATHALAFYLAVREPNSNIQNANLWLSVNFIISVDTWDAHRKIQKMNENKRFSIFNVLLLFIQFVFVIILTIYSSTLSTAISLCIYLAKSVIMRLIDLLLLHGNMMYPTVDHGAHLGGAIAGVATAVLQIGQPTFAIHSAVMVVFTSILYLLIRVITNF